MLDLTSPDVWPSTLNKIGAWAKQPYIREGYLSLFDAACLMAKEGYGGLLTEQARDSKYCSKATQVEIHGYFSVLRQATQGAGTLEGYVPVKKWVNGQEQSVYPLKAFRAFVLRTGQGDGRYFENTCTQSEKALALRVVSCGASGAWDVGGESEPPFGICDSDMAETVDEFNFYTESSIEGLDEEISLFSVQEAVIEMLNLDPDHLWKDRWDGKEFFRFEGVADALESALLESVYQDLNRYAFTFMDEIFPNPFNKGDKIDAKFSRYAFYQWWADHPYGLPCPKWFQDLRLDDVPFPDDEASISTVVTIAPPLPADSMKPSPVSSAPSLSDESREVEPPEDEGGNVAPDDMEIVPGVSVGNIRTMIDPESSVYCPRLLAAIKTKIFLMPREASTLTRETVYARYAREESVRFLKELGVVSSKDKSKNPEPADLDKNAVGRILSRAHKNKDGRPGNC